MKSLLQLLAFLENVEILTFVNELLKGVKKVTADGKIDVNDTQAVMETVYSGGYLPAKYKFASPEKIQNVVTLTVPAIVAILDLFKTQKGK